MATESSTRVLEALQQLYQSNDRQSTRDANRWLESFQKKPEAWQVADYLFNAENSTLETRLFAAQTFKQKITYDLRDLNVEARFQLRDSLFNMLLQSLSGPKAVMIQLCLAIADLAIQLLQWKTVVPDLVAKFGNSPQTLNCLLEILKVLPEEMNNNTRLPLTDVEYKARGAELIDSNGGEILNLLTAYVQTEGLTTELHEKIFKCLSSWIRTGEIDIRLLSASPLLGFAFKSLESPELFDVAVDVVSEIIYETRDVNEYQSVIQQIYPSFVEMLSKLNTAIEEEDEDSIRGYCRIFVEAGEAYLNLIGAHPPNFSVLLEGILKCSAYHDFDIVPMTFKFWYELTNLLQTQTYSPSRPQFFNYYDALVDVMIGHLRYPDDLESMTAEQRDDFRDFRHQMGDTLKDCCIILSPQRCLLKPMNLLTTLLSNSESSWQQIEAPIFSLRVMGSEVPKDENDVMPHIMKFLPQLPEHPKIRYATILVISRYSFWTAAHPEFVTDQLNFISAGFNDQEVAAASALALKHLCKDCKEHLVGFIPQLQYFFINVVKTLPFRDILEVTEAVSHVITVLPPNEIQNALQLFCLPVARELHGLVSKRKEGLSDEDFVKIGDLLEQISVFFNVIHPEIPLGQPHPCVTFVSELWPVLDTTLANFGGLTTVSEPLCKCFNSFILSFGTHFIPLLPQLMERLVTAFSTTGSSGYLWVSLKLVREYARDDGERPCFEFVKSQSQSLFAQIQRENVNNIPDVVEEYFRFVTAFLDNAPTLLVQDALLATIFQAGIAGLAITEIHALNAVLVFYRRLLENKSANVIALFKEYGANLTAALFGGLVDFYHEDSVPEVAALFKSLVEILPNESTQWVMQAVNDVPEDFVSLEAKNEFLSNWTSAVNSKQWIKVRRILSDFIATYRRRNASKVRR